MCPHRRGNDAHGIIDLNLQGKCKNDSSEDGMQISSKFVVKNTYKIIYVTMNGDTAKMLSFVYPFIKFTGQNFWIGCKPALILYLLYFILSSQYTRRHFISEGLLSVGTEEKNINIAWVCAYYTLLLLYFFLPSTGETENLIVGIARTYLQYESLLSGAMVAVLAFLILSRATWQHIRILDKAANLLGSVHIRKDVITCKNGTDKRTI